MKFLHTFLCLFFAVFIVNAQYSDNQYARLKIDLSDTSIESLARLGLETDHGVLRPGEYLINDFSTREMELLEANDYSFQILISDVQKHYVEQNKHSHTREFETECVADLYPYATPENYEFGSMGGYLTYDELLNTLDSMNARYPHLISKREQIRYFIQLSIMQERRIVFLRWCFISGICSRTTKRMMRLDSSLTVHHCILYHA